MKEVARGAEAILRRDNDRLLKHRPKKAYRHPDLDSRLRKKRTKIEAKLLRDTPSAPKVYDITEDTIQMDFIEGKTVTETLKTTTEIMGQVAKAITEIHNQDISHGDLTTTNIIHTDKDDVAIIDFGLGGYNAEIEQKAVDLYVLKKSILSSYPEKAETAWKTFITQYEPANKKDILRRLEAVEKRGRYKQK